jgi:membrane protease YdiL (CAAX protease family)
LRALVTLAAPHAGGLALSLGLLALKATTGVIVPLLLVRALRPTLPAAIALGLRAPPAHRRRVGVAVVVALTWFAIIFGLATAQAGAAPSLKPASLSVALLAAIHVLVEELSMRGLFLGWMAGGRAFWRANLLVSALFLSMHLPGWIAAGPSPELIPMAIVLFLLSLVLGWVTRLSGTIWIAFVLHLANNALSGW